MKKIPLIAYKEEEILFFIGELVDAKYPLSDIEQQLRDQFIRSLGSRGFS